MKLNQRSLTNLKESVKKATTKYKDSKLMSVTDIHMQICQESGEISIFDDEDNKLSSTVIEEWATYENDDFMEKVERVLTKLLKEMKKDGSFDKLAIAKPYSFILVDEDKETIAELLLMDDDNFIIDDELLKGLDKELDDFLKDLLEK